MLNINIPKILNEDGFEEVLSSVLDTLRYPGTIKIDFSNTTFITSYAMCLIILLCDTLIKKYKRKSFSFMIAITD